MDTVILDGIEYKKASVVAKEFRYTSDYIGQLCRAKKIDARLVGRTWFVNPSSITDHKKTKHKKVPKAEIESLREQFHQKPAKLAVEPVIKSKTAKLVSQTSNSSDAKVVNLKVSYQPDEGSLYPEVSAESGKPAKSIRVEHAEATEIRVKGGKKATSFKAEELPEVSLSGTLKIVEAADRPAETGSDNMPENKDISDKREKKVVKVRVKKSDNNPDKTMSSTEKTKQSLAPDTADKPLKGKVSGVKTGEVNFTPESAYQPVEVVHISSLKLASPLIASLLALVCVTAIFSAHSTVKIADSGYFSSIEFQAANLLEIISTR
tara:strand:+ start:104 stop:1066 length:963 start_codon:yes stop_codon:yes gene_type:complete